MLRMMNVRWRPMARKLRGWAKAVKVVRSFPEIVTTIETAPGPLERFEVEREVGHGAAGIVFRAKDLIDGRPVALKVIASPDPDDEARIRFLDEGELLSGIEHPGIVRIVDFGTLGDDSVELAGRVFMPATPYIAMEWLEGMDLERRHHSAPLSLPQSLECARQVASALGCAHSSGIVHRDVKPSNVIVLAADDSGDEPFRVKLVDFGVACDAGSITALGPMVGTPAYMAPEQARGDTVFDPRCDVYSLGATLFELISGRPPHIGPSPIAIVAKLVSTPAQRLSELVLDVPGALDDLVADMLELEWRLRPDMHQVETRVAALLADPSLPKLAGAIDKQHESVHSSVSRLVTTVVALQAGTGSEREALITQMSERGAETEPLGKDSVVAFLGARRAHGGEAKLAIKLGKELMSRGARVGVATGRALVDLARPVGAVVDKASSLAREAPAGKLYADETTAELARSEYEFNAVSHPPSSGAVVSERVPTSAWAVSGRLPDRKRKAEQTPFVGRAGELELLFNAYERCLDDHSPVVVSISGPPGIGKSRLAREFLLRLDDYRYSRPPVTEPSAGMSGGTKTEVDVTTRVVMARCEAYGRQRALGTAADTLSDLLRIPKGADLDQVRVALSQYTLEHDENGLLASLLAGEPFTADVDPLRARDILYLAMTELMLMVARDEPVVLMLEDVQWSDPESVAWFDHLLNRAAGCALAVVVLARPRFWKEYPQRFGSRDHVRIELRPIPRRATMEIARSLIGCDIDDPKLRDVAKQAAGSPLFAEELARVIASGKEAATVPTIEAAIQVSLDQLDSELHDALVRMSVFGLSTWDNGLAAVGTENAESVLDRLIDAEMVVEQALSRFVGTREFWFKHALVRDVTYASASDAMRKENHAKIADWLSEVGEDAATIAEHYDLGDRSGTAAGYWEQAAKRALAANALTDAVRMADRALTFAEGREEAFARATLLDEAWSRLDERAADRAEAIEAMSLNAYDEAAEVRTQGARARYDHARSAGHDIEQRLVDAATRSKELSLTEEEARCIATLAARYAFAGDLAKAEEEAAHLLDLAERAVPSAAVDAWQALAVVRQTRGELAAALEARRNAAHAAAAAGLKQREATLTINLGFALTTIGAKGEARREIESGIRMAEEIGSAGTVRLGRMILLGWAAQFGDDPSLDEALREPRANADEAATGAWIVKDRVTLGVLFYRGCELLMGGQQQSLGRARSLLQISADAYRATKNRDVLPVALGYWAEAERKLGEIETAEKIAKEAADLMEAGAPSLLNEAVIYLALHGARVDLGDLVGAHRAIERGMTPLLRRVRGLRGTEYERAFLKLSHNARLLEAADAHACLPEELEPMLD